MPSRDRCLAPGRAGAGPSPCSSRRPVALPGSLLALAILLALPGCGDRGAHPGSASRPARGEQVDSKLFLQSFSSRFDALYGQAVEQAVPAGSGLAAALAEVGPTLAERGVLERVYTAGAPLRFVGPRGLDPAGELLAATLAAVDGHGLDPRRFGLPELAELQAALSQAVEQAAAAGAAPSPPQGEEAKELAQLVRALEPSLRLPEAEQALMARLVGEQSPFPRLHAAFAAACQARQLQQQAAARLELGLADRLLRYARELRRGNTASAERAARKAPAAAGPAAPEAASTEPRQGQERRPTDPDAGLDAAPDGGAPASTGHPLVLRDRPAFVRLLLEEDLRRVTDRESLARLLEELQPPYAQYPLLQAALKRYREIAARGGWETVPPNGALRPGKSHPTVPLLERRLAAEGFLAAPTGQKNYGPELEQAVRRYQEAHQLEVTGRPHAVFWKSLNIPVERRVQAIELTLQRWRESRIGDDRYYVFINVPDFYLELWKDGQRLLRNRIVAGANRGVKCDEETETEVLERATPLQSALIEYLVLSPYWNVTRSIKEKELDPERGKDPLYYEKNGYEVMERDTPREWVRELPGPSNSLGFVKFIFPNPHNTFVHDTPLKELFRQTVRAFSHGCMRLQEPLQLAKLLLVEDGQWSEQAFEHRYQTWQTMKFSRLKEHYDPDLYEEMRSRAEKLEKTVYLRQPVPIHIEYYTVRVDDSGQVQFLADIYGYDQQRLDPRRPKSCVPEKKLAKRNFQKMPERVEAYQGEAVELVPLLVRASELGKELQPKGPWLERNLLKELQVLEKFTEQHENLARRILEEHQQVSRALEERRGRWNKRLEAEAVRLQRLMKGLAQMTAKARQTCRQIEQVVGAKKKAEAPPPASPSP